jgi:hypothetical protein
MRFYVADNLIQIHAQQRFAAGDLNNTWTKYFHVFPVIWRLQIAGGIPGTSVVAMLAVARARIRHLK